MTVQADTIRQSMPRPKASVHDKVPRKATCQESVRENGKTKFLKKGGKPHGEQKLYDR